MSSVNPKDRIRKVDRRMFGLNAAVWDGAYPSPNTQALLTELDNQALRFPGGSLSDVYHWQTNMSEGQTFEWANSFDDFIQIAGQTHAASYITVNYGTGTPEEAAAWVKYANKVCAATCATGKSATRTTAPGKRTTTRGRTIR